MCGSYIETITVNAPSLSTYLITVFNTKCKGICMMSATSACIIMGGDVILAGTKYCLSYRDVIVAQNVGQVIQKYKCST